MLTAVLLTIPLALPDPPVATGDFDHAHAAWTAILEEHLEDGLVDYAALRRAPAALDAYLADLAATTPAEHAKWTREKRFAFWINAYNAFTIQLVRDGGPVMSIKELGGWFSTPWEKKFIPMPAFDPEGKGKEITLDEIEHELIRPVFDDARVHAAVNCASMSCPPLRAEAYRAADLDEQLDDQVRQWLGDPKRNDLEVREGKIRVSRIFDWYDGDFGKKDAAVIRWIADHVADEALAKGLRERAGGLKLRYLDYDWSINALPKKR